MRAETNKNELVNYDNLFARNRMSGLPYYERIAFIDMLMAWAQMDDWSMHIAWYSVYMHDNDNMPDVHFLDIGPENVRAEAITILKYIRIADARVVAKDTRKKSSLITCLGILRAYAQIALAEFNANTQNK